MQASCPNFVITFRIIYFLKESIYSKKLMDICFTENISSLFLGRNWFFFMDSSLVHMKIEALGYWLWFPKTSITLLMWNVLNCSFAQLFYVFQYLLMSLLKAALKAQIFSRASHSTNLDHNKYSANIFKGIGAYNQFSTRILLPWLSCVHRKTQVNHTQPPFCSPCSVAADS